MSPNGAQPTRREPSSWAVGFTGFAAFMLIFIGIFQVIVGIAAIWQNAFYVVTSDYVFHFNVTSWGIIHIVVGGVVFLAGLSLFTGATWARVVGVIFALVQGIANFMFLPYFPLWSILIIAVDVAVIWALTAHGRDITEY